MSIKSRLFVEHALKRIERQDVLKKIAFYIDSMEMGGANRVVANLTEYFSGQGYEVILINDITPRTHIKTYKILSEVKRFYLDENIQYRRSVEKQYKRIYTLRKVLKEENVDTVVSFMGPPNYRLLLATIGLKIKKVVSVRNDPYREYGGGIKKIIAKNIFKLADACVFQTNDAAEYFSKAVRRKSQIIFNPVNPKFFQTEWIGNEKNIAVVGRLQKQKNPVLAVKAFEKIANEFPEYTMTYYGEGELRDELIEYIKKKSLNEQVIIYGKVTDVEKYLSQASVFVLSSDYEGLPNALMEAMAVGIPCISTDCPCGGPRSLIQNERQGVLVPCNDIQMLADAMRVLLKNGTLRSEMSLEEKNRAKKFAPEVIFKQWEEFLQ